MAKPQLWPIFICYRRVDGLAVARRLHEMLDKWQIDGPDGQAVQLDVYLDETMPGVADWKKLHRPYLERARAIIVICTPGSKLNEGIEDWVHKEVDWWLENRQVAPILIDPLMEGGRYIPSQINERWPDIQRISIVDEEWKSLTEPALREKSHAVRNQILGAILPSGAEIYVQELEKERHRARRLRLALTGSLLLLLLALITGGLAFYSGRVAEASRLDAVAAQLFEESRLLDIRIESEIVRRIDLTSRIDASEPASTRQINLAHELDQINEELLTLKTQRSDSISKGLKFIDAADAAWKDFEAIGLRAPIEERNRPDAPHIFSIELLNAGRGESILVYFGMPDRLNIVMINGGPRKSFRESIAPRLKEIGISRFSGGPVPISLFIVGDRDVEKTDGLLQLLEHIDATDSSEELLINIQEIWANIFSMKGGRASLRPRIRKLIDDIEIPLNQPFDHHVMRPDEGLVSVSLAGGLEIIVLGPKRSQIAKLHRFAARNAERRDGVIELLKEESFSNIDVAMKPTPLSPSLSAERNIDCTPSENARNLAGGQYRDMSVANLASSVLLFRYRGKTFLYTGDARGDHILEGLDAAGLLDNNGQAHVDLLSIPHMGSENNITVDFFQRVRADGYLFSGDGTHGNPEVETVAALIAARDCDFYRMYFVNRDGRSDEHGTNLDEFFKAEQEYSPNYRRIFRSLEGGSVTIDLLEPVRY